MRSGPRIDRRQFLEQLAGAGVITLGSSRIDAAQSEVARHLLQLSAYPLDVETPLEALTSYVTPNDLFFVRTHWTPTRVNPATWSLTVDGEVSKPLRLSLVDLRALPRADVTCVLQCSGNGRNWFDPPVPGVQWRYGAVGNARWSGVRVRDVLSRAALKSVTRHLHTFGGNPPPGQVPPFNRSLEIDKALGDAIIAYEMNGEPLPHGHGGPVRLVVPGWAGDHWMKWLSRLSASREPQVGFYMETAYSTRSVRSAPAPRCLLTIRGRSPRCSSSRTLPLRLRVFASASVRLSVDLHFRVRRTSLAWSSVMMMA